MLSRLGSGSGSVLLGCALSGAGIGSEVVRAIRWDDAFDGGDEAVAAAGQGFDEAGAGGGVAEGFADAIDGGVDAVFGVDEGAVGPELAGDFFAGEEFAGAVEEQAEDLEGLGVELEADALAAELAGGGVGFEGSEAIARVGWLWAGHVWLSSVADGGGHFEACWAMENSAEVAWCSGLAR